MAETRDEALLEDLVARCVIAFEIEGESGVDAVCRAHPEVASVVRARLADLQRRGLLESSPDPKQIGPYRVLEALGRGGMGTVYLAEQREPVRRRVALKVIKPGMDSQEVIARFTVERQALAVMDHPHIAKIFDAGTTPQGRPYFAMEYVPGLPLTEYCDKHRLPIADRLQLFVGICEAVQHAHHKGVIHRDLKPANILVAEHSGEPMPRIIDFGIAKATLAGFGTSAVHTSPGQVVGTLDYMSPEQAAGDPLDVDSRTDVYSLGVILFELLTGQLPFADLGKSNLLDMLRVIQEVEPSPPSNIVAMAAQPGAREAADLRQTEHTSLRRLLRGDLDTIALRALAKDRTRRYPSPVELCADVRRFLDGEPIHTFRAPRAAKLRLLAVALVAIVLGVAGGVSWMVFTASVDRPIVLRRLTEFVGMEDSPAISRDGERVVFVSRVNGVKQIFLRLLTEGAPTPITDHVRDCEFPRWIDDNKIMYRVAPAKEGAPGTLYEQVTPSASPPRRIEEVYGEADVSHSGNRVAVLQTVDGKTSLVIFDRERKKVLDSIDLDWAGMCGSPRWSPDDRQIAFEAWLVLNRAEIQVMDLETRTPKRVIETNQTRGLAWLPDGSGFVYASSKGSTLAYPPVFRLRTVRIDGEEDRPLSQSDAGYASYVNPDVTAAGRLVASRVRLESDIYQFPTSVSAWENVKNKKRITKQTGLVQVPSASPDGKEVAYLCDNGGKANIWVARVDGSADPRPITNERDPATLIGLPVWAPKGDRIVYIKGHQGSDPGLWLIDRNGTGTGGPLVESAGAASWSKDGKWVYFGRLAGPVTTELATFRIHVENKKLEPVREGAIGLVVSPDGKTEYFCPSTFETGTFLKAAAGDFDPDHVETLCRVLNSRIPVWPHGYTLSPDGKWLATPLKDRDTTNLWLIPAMGGGMRRVTDFGDQPTIIGRQVSWSSDSQSIFAAVVELDADIVYLDGALR